MQTAVTSASNTVPTGLAKWIMTLAAIFIFSLVLVTGSRAGLLLYGVALIITLLYAFNGAKSKLLFEGRTVPTSGASWKVLIPRYGLFVLTFVVVTAVLLSGRADTLKRLTGTDPSGEPRLTIFEPLMSAVLNFMPFGSGIGSFDPVFRGFEAKEILGPNYWNHAHNDWLEAIMTAGLPAIVLIIVGMIWLIKYFSVLKIESSKTPGCALFGFVGGSVLVLIAISSLVEYPLRVPIISCLFAMAIALISNDPVSGRRNKS